jgi:hypothetical protein
MTRLFGLSAPLGVAASCLMLAPIAFRWSAQVQGGVALAGIGAFVIFESLVVETEDGEKIGKWAWRPLFFIIAANLAFGVLLGGLPSVRIPAMGLIAAIYALTIISSMADGHFHIRDTLILATVLAIGSYLAFIVLLKLQIQVWPSFITG